MLPFKPNGYPVNRTQIRAMGKEYDKINDSIFAVEDSFVIQLFTPSAYSYNELYRHYLSQYQQCLKYIQKVVKPKYFTLEDNYFKNKYKPIENVSDTGDSAEATH